MTLIPHARSPEFVRHAMLASESAEQRHAELMAPYLEPVTRPAAVVASLPRPTLKPRTSTESGNKLRPRRLDEMIGQQKLKPLMRRLIDSACTSGEPLDHLLLVGASGTGKTTLASVVANEIGTRVFELKAPVDMGTLMELRDVARDDDVIFLDEIHLQVNGDRRGLTQACDSESFYLLLEDGILATPTGPLNFPQVTWIGATTDVGLLPEPLSNRFTIQPRLAPYTEDDMAEIARYNAVALGIRLAGGVDYVFARAARGVPRMVNNYLRAARQLGNGLLVDHELAREVIEDLCSTTLDGLTESMQTVLRHLYLHCGRPTKDGVVYSASVNTLATAAGHGRDTKAISLLVEPYLLQRGLLQVRPTGRTLTPTGVDRARELTRG